MLVKLAKDIATKAHEGQYRWDGKTPYITHPAAVAKIVSHLCQLPLGVPKTQVVATAWLHDVIEDTYETPISLGEQGIPPDVLTALKLLTKRKGQSYLDYILRLRKNKIACIVKVADITHNMSCFPKDKRSGSLYQKYELALYLLQDGL